MAIEPVRPGGGVRRHGWVILTLAAGLALTLGLWAHRGRPVALPDVTVARLPCVSYAPFRRPGQTPFDPELRVTAEQIEQDLRILKARTGCVRTYGTGQGLDQVPAVARRFGMTVRQGAWLGRDDAANAAEVERALALAREHRDVVEMLIVGSEVLLRGELEPGALAAWLSRARKGSPVDVGYADVWEFWLRHEDALRAHVDLAIIHVLPYWEDEPVAVGDAVAHVHRIARMVQERLAGLPVWIGETGWPSAGRQRGPAVPGRLEQARFVRELVGGAAGERLDYNLIEGFDQPWKRALEGAMGGHWGLYDNAGVARFAWSGPVQRDPHWRLGLVAAAAGAVVGLGVALARFRAWWPACALALALASIASLGVVQWQAMQVWNRTPAEWVIGGAAHLAALLCSVLAALRIAALLSGAARVPSPGIAGALATPLRAASMFAFARAAVLFSAATVALELVFDSRYRELAWPLVATPALLLLALVVAGERTTRDAREERWLALVSALCAPAIVLLEGFENGQALLFAAVLLVLAGAAAWPGREGRARRGRQQAGAGNTPR